MLTSYSKTFERLKFFNEGNEGTTQNFFPKELYRSLLKPLEESRKYRLYEKGNLLPNYVEIEKQSQFLR